MITSSRPVIGHATGLQTSRRDLELVNLRLEFLSILTSSLTVNSNRRYIANKFFCNIDQLMRVMNIAMD